MIVLDDMDVDYAVRTATFGSFFHQGQICLNTRRIIVQRKIADEFLKPDISHLDQLAQRPAPIPDLNRNESTRSQVMTVPNRIWIKVLTAILVAPAFGLGASHVLASPKGTATESSGGDWVYVDHDLAGTRYSHLNQITLKNV